MRATSDAMIVGTVRIHGLAVVARDLAGFAAFGVPPLDPLVQQTQ